MGLGGGAKRDKRVLVALVALDLLLLFADIAPDFVKLDPADAQANHHAVMQFGTAAPDALAKAHDGVAVDAGQALGGADALALGETGDDCNLLVAGKDIHGANPWVGIGPTAGNAAPTALY